MLMMIHNTEKIVTEYIFPLVEFSQFFKRITSIKQYYGRGKVCDTSSSKFFTSFFSKYKNRCWLWIFFFGPCLIDMNPDLLTRQVNHPDITKHPRSKNNPIIVVVITAEWAQVTLFLMRCCQFDFSLQMTRADGGRQRIRVVRQSSFLSRSLSRKWVNIFCCCWYCTDGLRDCHLKNPRQRRKQNFFEKWKITFLPVTNIFFKKILKNFGPFWSITHFI